MDDMKLSRSAMIAITVLRVIVGWHFLYEGIAKLSSSSWSAAGYMRVSRGPFAAFFKWIASNPQMLENANLITMYGLTIVGLLLILGLFTRLAAIGGIATIVEQVNRYPGELELLAVILHRAVERRQLQEQVRTLREVVGGRHEERRRQCRYKWFHNRSPRTRKPVVPGSGRSDLLPAGVGQRTVQPGYWRAVHSG